MHADHLAAVGAFIPLLLLLEESRYALVADGFQVGNRAVVEPLAVLGVQPLYVLAWEIGTFVAIRNFVFLEPVAVLLYVVAAFAAGAAAGTAHFPRLAGHRVAGIAHADTAVHSARGNQLLFHSKASLPPD